MDGFSAAKPMLLNAAWIAYVIHYCDCKRPELLWFCLGGSIAFAIADWRAAAVRKHDEKEERP